MVSYANSSDKSCNFRRLTVMSLCENVQNNSFPKACGPQVGSYLHFGNQPDMSLHCETKCIMWYVFYSPVVRPVPNHTAWWQRHIGVNNLPRVTTQRCPSQPDVWSYIWCCTKWATTLPYVNMDTLHTEVCTFTFDILDFGSCRQFIGHYHIDMMEQLMSRVSCSIKYEISSDKLNYVICRPVHFLCTLVCSLHVQFVWVNVFLCC